MFQAHQVFPDRQEAVNLRLDDLARKGLKIYQHLVHKLIRFLERCF